MFLRVNPLQTAHPRDPNNELEVMMEPMCVAVAQNQWYHFGVGAPPILEPILVGIGMFTGANRAFDMSLG